MNDTKIVQALLRSRVEAERVITDLRSTGISPDDISLLLPDAGILDHIATRAAVTPSDATPRPGSPLGMLRGLGSVHCSGVEHLLGAGPIRRVLDGTGIRSVAAALRSLGVTEQRAAMYEGRIRDGGIWMAVHTSLGKELGDARRILALHGGYEVGIAARPAPAFVARS